MIYFDVFSIGMLVGIVLVETARRLGAYFGERAARRDR